MLAEPAPVAALVAGGASSSSSTRRSPEGPPAPEFQDVEAKPPVQITLDGLRTFERTADMIQKGPATDRRDLGGRNWGGKEKVPIIVAHDLKMFEI